MRAGRRRLRYGSLLAYAKDNKYPLVLDFSDVRPCGSPIHGMQERPASGPLSIMRAFMNVRKDVIAAAKINPMPLWEQNLRFDHFFSVEVQVGGARRAARMATKSWKDPGILKFIRIKEEGGLWTANHSIMVDQEFWMAVRDNDAVATKIFDESTRCAYETGEPGFINADKLEDHRTGFARKHAIGSQTFPESPVSKRESALTSNRVVLCVDDDAALLALRCLVLSGAGYDVLTAADGPTALELFRRIQVNLVITDHCLPGLTGAQLAAEMKRLKPAVPIVLFSGLVEAPPESEHVDLVIIKGMPVVEFLRQIGKLIP